jgi:hypothetical protein
MESRELTYLGLPRQSEARTAAFGRLARIFHTWKAKRRDELVAQVSNLLYRRFPNRQGLETFGASAGLENPRYSRLGSLRYNLRMKYPG